MLHYENNSLEKHISIYLIYIKISLKHFLLREFQTLVLNQQELSFIFTLYHVEIYKKKHKT